jgi:hypothetical protein
MHEEDKEGTFSHKLVTNKEGSGMRLSPADLKCPMSLLTDVLDVVVNGYLCKPGGPLYKGIMAHPQFIRMFFTLLGK